MKEYDTARTRIENEISQINQNEIVYVTLWAAFYVGLYQFEIVNKFAHFIVGLITFLIAIYGWFRYSTHRRVIILHEMYVKYVIEFVMYKQPEDACVDRTHGLVAYYDKHKSSSLLSREASGHLKMARYVIWVILGALSLCYILIALRRPEWLANLRAK